MATVGVDVPSKTAETWSVVKSAEHWKREAKTVTEPLMFDTAVSRLEPGFKDVNNSRIAFCELAAGVGLLLPWALPDLVYNPSNVNILSLSARVAKPF